VPFARPLVFFGAGVFSDRQLALEMESRAGAAWALAQVRVPSPFHGGPRQLQEPQGYLGRHHERPRSADADLGGLAEFERELIRARTGEGRKRTKERGVRFGRPRKMTPGQRQEALQRLAAGETQADVARSTIG
jgi:hypothetical protein